MNDKYKDSIYEELKGFFPAEYDLTPEELESLPDRNTSQLGDIGTKDIPTTKEASFVEIAPVEKSTEQEHEIISAESETVEKTLEDNKTPTTATKKKYHDLFDLVEMFAVCVACIIVVFSFFARLTVVDGDSMNDTLLDGEFLIISNFMYTPDQGDIVVLQDTTAGHSELQKPLIKRVIAVGGQSVKITQDGVVTVTDKDGSSTVLEDSYIKQEAYEGRYYGEWDIPEGFVFVMGDNRNHSTDSRDFRLGIIDERCIVGEAKIRVLPFDKISVLENPFK